MVYLPTFTIEINQMQVDIPYMDPMGWKSHRFSFFLTSLQFPGPTGSHWLGSQFPPPWTLEEVNPPVVVPSEAGRQVVCWMSIPGGDEPASLGPGGKFPNLYKSKSTNNSMVFSKRPFSLDVH